MASVILKITSQDETFADFYENLAQELGEGGTVYTRHPVIPRNARVPVPRPTEILVSLPSVDDFATLYRVLEQYLTRSAGRRLTIENTAHADPPLRLETDEVPSQLELARTLFP